MNANYIRALTNTLASPASGPTINGVAFKNATGMPVDMFLCDSTGARLGFASGGSTGAGLASIRINDQATTTLNQVIQGSWVVFTCAHTGGFVSVMSANQASSTQTLLTSYLASPNDIGPIPEPSATALVPGDSPKVVVGCGTVNGGTILREQFWHLQPQSYSIADGETREVTHTTTSGLQHVSSQQDTVEKSLGLTAGAGWGPISASVSSSINQSSTTFQEVTVNRRETSYMSDLITNNAGYTVTVLYWQLTDVVTIFDSKGKGLASVVQGELPEVIGGPYPPAPPSPPPPSPPPSLERREVAEIPEPTAVVDVTTATWNGIQLVAAA